MSSVADRIRENAGGMFADLVFAVVWVAVVTAVHGVLQGPGWAYYMLLLAGVPAYFVFHASLSAATEETATEETAEEAATEGEEKAKND